MCHPEVPAGTRMPEIRTEEVRVLVPGADMPALLALPERVPAGTVLVINDVFGRSPFYENLARRLAQAGFAALDPEFFHRIGPLAQQTRAAATARREKLDQALAIEDLSAAIDWLRARRDVCDGRVATIGFCMGGTYVLQLGARRGDLAGGVSYYGFPASGKAGERPLDLADRMRGPLLGHWGDQDEGVGLHNVKELDRRLAASGVEHTFHVYPGLGHGFLKSFLEDERSPGYEEACTSWKRTLEFYRRTLRVVQPAAAPTT